MIDGKDLDRKEEELGLLMAEKFGASRGPLQRRLRRIGRRVPAHVQAAGRVLVQARQMSDHPKLALQTDVKAVDRAFVTLRDHLKSVNASERRKDVWLGLAGSLSLNLLAVGALLVIVLLWRGFL